MFTSTMTHDEILREARLDYYELKPRMELAFTGFRHKYSGCMTGERSLLGQISEKKTFKTRRHNIWTLELHVNHFYQTKMHGGCLLYIPVPRSNGMSEYLFIWNLKVFIPELFSSHFVQRYKERYIEPNKINLMGMHPALYFERKNTDLRRTYFIPRHWTKEDMKNKLIWISNQGLFVTVNHGGLRVYVTFLDQQDLSHYKALVYEEENLQRMYDNLLNEYDRTKGGLATLEHALNMITVFETPNAREIHERFLWRTCNREGDERKKYVRESMESWDRLEKVTRNICDEAIRLFNEHEMKEGFQFDVPGMKEYAENYFRLLAEKGNDGSLI